jgi:hypothetical protein
MVVVQSSGIVMAHGDVREGKWRGNWRMEWVANTLHTTSEHGVSSITTADAHTSAASSRLNWRPCRFKWTRPFRRKTKSGFCACAITFQTQLLISFRGWVDLRAIVRPEGLHVYQWQFPMTPSGIEPATFRLVKVMCIGVNTHSLSFVIESHWKRSI